MFIIHTILKLGDLHSYFAIFWISTLNCLLNIFSNLEKRKIPTSEGRNLEDDDEDDIAGLLQDEEKKAVLPSYVPPDGEFHQFPEICKRTVENLQAKGY